MSSAILQVVIHATMLWSPPDQVPAERLARVAVIIED